MVFVWAGLSQPPRTSLWLAPLAAAAYIAPPLFGVAHGANAAESAEVAIPACVLVGEVVARISRSDANARFELAKAFEAQRELAWRDPLTGLYNRRAFIELGSAIVAGAASRGQAPAALFLDLDGLKTINDTWGHETGDALIAQAGRLIASSAPAGSTCARLGGDEFCVLAESEDQARLAMGQVAQAQAQLPAHPSGATLSLSIAVGRAAQLCHQGASQMAPAYIPANRPRPTSPGRGATRVLIVIGDPLEEAFSTRSWSVGSQRPQRPERPERLGVVPLVDHGYDDARHDVPGDGSDEEGATPGGT